MSSSGAKNSPSSYRRYLTRGGSDSINLAPFSPPKVADSRQIFSSSPILLLLGVEVGEVEENPSHISYLQSRQPRPRGKIVSAAASEEKRAPPFEPAELLIRPRAGQWPLKNSYAGPGLPGPRRRGYTHAPWIERWEKGVFGIWKGERNSLNSLLLPSDRFALSNPAEISAEGLKLKGAFVPSFLPFCDDVSVTFRQIKGKMEGME